MRFRTPSSFTAPVRTEEPGTPTAPGMSPASNAQQGAEPRATPPSREEPRPTRPGPQPRICLSTRLRAGLWGPGRAQSR
ncbi:hypothetical protein E5288_WYG022182 [Bos mutus]|uniref:Uncharacterized protein n=1 Tax=Bos mutus TaxID=72004 RepID=A0A6B0RNY3_9CETA|nr:hypothetical protein [Bos mutus]